MATNRNDIGNKFETGDIPSQADFKEIFDSFVHKDEDKATIAMVDAGTDDEHYITPALLRVGLQNIGAISGGGNLPYKQHVDNFGGSYILLDELPIEASVKVFKNGQLLLEGEDGDYTINYETATVLFLDPVEGRNIEIDYWYKNLDPTPDTSGNYVDLTTDQTIAGKKTFDNLVIDAQNVAGIPFYYEDFATGFGDFVSSPNGDAPWVWVTDDGAEGSTSSISSGTIGHLSNSAVELTVSTNQESTLLKYWYKTSTETSYDYLHIEINGVIVKRYAGINDWTEGHVFIHGIGPQLIKFIYVKDNNFIGGIDKVWIDKVSLTNISEDLIVNSDALFTNNVTFRDGLIGKGLSSFKDLTVKGIYNQYSNTGDVSVSINSHDGGGGGLYIYNDGLSVEAANISTNTDRTILQLNKYNTGSEFFKVWNDLTFPDGVFQMLYPGARAIIGSHGLDYTDFTFAVNGNTKLDGSLDTTSIITADQFVKRGGSSSEFLKADGSVDTNVYGLDTNVVHKIGDETITGNKLFTEVADFIGVRIDNGGSNRGLSVTNNGAVQGVVIRSTDSGDSLIINDSVTATGTPLKIQKDDVTKFSVDGNGQTTASSFVKSEGTSDDVLLADGTTTSLSGLGGGSSPLSALDEGNGNGYRLSNADPLNFGNIGEDAVDFSYSDTPSDVLGATGSSAFAMGSDVIASNFYSTVFGYLVDNNGIGSFDSGFNLKDSGYTNSLFGIGHDVTSMNTTVVGQAANIITDQIADFNYTSNKKLFVVGNGTIQNADDNYTVNTRSDALVVRLNGSVEAPSLTTSLIDTDVTGKVVVTKEWVQTQTTQRPYKVYTALLSQSGTNAPTAIVLENTLGETIVWSRNGGGGYTATSNGTFIFNKTTCTVSAVFASHVVASQRVNINEVTVKTSDISSGVPVLSDNVLTVSTLEIRVYN